MNSKQLRELRISKGLTQVFVARRVGCRAGYISAIERDREKPSADMIERIIGAIDRNAVIKREKTAEEKWWHEVFCDRYGN